jgi:hypothetical protein
MNILSIDIGILNLGFVYCNIYDNGKINVIDCDKIDITIMRHHTVPFCDCILNHDNCFPDYLEHFFQEYSSMFTNADIILLERQPIRGITNVQDLILSKFRYKTLLISPKSVHKHFYMSKLYESRKKESQKIAQEYLLTNEKYVNLNRKHDISDAMLIIIYYNNLFIKKKEKLVVNDFEVFRYIPNKTESKL